MQRFQSELHTLLSDAFDGWGSDDYFEWKYTQYPNYDPETDNFTIENDAGRVVAARRVFRHTVWTPEGDSLSAHIHGGTAVAEPYRGRGYYTELLSESTEQSEREADCLFTFNRAGKITTKHHKKNGWNWIRLPVYAAVISPSRVYSHYISDSNVITKVASQLSLIDRKLTANSVISQSMARVAGRLYGDSDRTFHATEKSEESPPENGVTAGSALDDRGDSVPSYNIHRYSAPIAESTVREIHERLRTELTEWYHFGRSIERLKHCLSYPNLNLFVARKKTTGEILDFVAVGTINKEGLTESRVLEQSWSYPPITQALFRAVDRECRQNGVDVIVAASTIQPGSQWVSLGTEYMMWPPTANSRQLPTDRQQWRVTMYDIL